MTDAELYTLIQSDPEALAAYTASNDDACAARCSEIAPTLKQPVPAALFRKTLMKRGRWSELRRVANNIESTDPPYSQAMSLVDTVTAEQPIDTEDPDLIAGGQVLVQHNLLSPADLTALSALAVVRQTITQQQVGAAREWYRVTGGVSNGTT